MALLHHSPLLSSVLQARDVGNMDTRLHRLRLVKDAQFSDTKGFISIHEQQASHFPFPTDLSPMISLVKNACEPWKWLDNGWLLQNNELRDMKERLHHLRLVKDNNAVSQEASLGYMSNMLHQHPRTWDFINMHVQQASHFSPLDRSIPSVIFGEARMHVNLSWKWERGNELDIVKHRKISRACDKCRAACRCITRHRTAGMR